MTVHKRPLLERVEGSLVGTSGETKGGVGFEIVASFHGPNEKDPGQIQVRYSTKIGEKALQLLTDVAPDQLLRSHREADAWAQASGEVFIPPRRRWIVSFFKQLPDNVRQMR